MVVTPFVARIDANAGDVVAAGDGDAQGRGIGIAVRIPHRVAEGLGQGLAFSQPLNQRIAVVQQEAVSTVAGVGEGAKAGRGAAPGHEAVRRIRARLTVGMQVVVQHAAGNRRHRVFTDAVAVVHRVRHVIEDFDNEVCRSR